MLTLWQTALLRLSRLRLQDEIDEALRYYELSLFDVVPAINAELRRALDERWPDAGLLRRPMLLPGSWIGGDRDGNPFVTADALRRATTRQAETALGHHLARARRRCAASCRCPTGWSRRPHELYAPRRGLPATTRPFRADEPYRRALDRHRRPAGGHRATRCSAACPARRRTSSCRATTRPDELRADLDVVDTSLRSHGAGALADDRLLPAARGGRGLRLPPLRAGHAAELRRPRGGRSPSCWPGPASATTTPPLDEDARVELLAGELTLRRPLVRPDAELSETARGELDVLVAAAEQVRAARARAPSRTT